MSNNDDKETKVQSYLVSILTGWGVKESWAKILVGAIIGALGAMGFFSLSGCAESIKLDLPDGRVAIIQIVDEGEVQEGK